VHHAQETRALKAVEHEHQSWQKRETQPGPSATVTQMKLMKVICTRENRMVQEFQSRMQLWYWMNLKNCGSICDTKCQSEIHFRKQIYHSRFQYRMMITWHRKMQNHR
jgi:hypothetical protein